MSRIATVATGQQLDGCPRQSLIALFTCPNMASVARLGHFWPIRIENLVLAELNLSANLTPLRRLASSHLFASRYRLRHSVLCMSIRYQLSS